MGKITLKGFLVSRSIENLLVDWWLPVVAWSQEDSPCPTHPIAEKIGGAGLVIFLVEIKIEKLFGAY